MRFFQFFEFMSPWRFGVLVAIFVPLEQLFSLHRSQKLFRRWWWNDALYIWLNRLVVQPGFALGFVAASVAARWLVPADVAGAVGGQPLVLQIVETIILGDLGVYAAHRMFHAVPWLWPFHAIHHSSEELDWLSAVRVHPVDQIVTKSLSVLPLVALGFSTPALAAYGVIFYWHAFLVHSNVRIAAGPLRWLVATPAFHHWHHSNQPAAYNKNFAAQLPVLDKLFGTLHLPPTGGPEAYGVSDPVPHTYLPQLMYPFERRGALRAGGVRGAPLGGGGTSWPANTTP
jgi:sterol desaturase/sphingolipid hydroxylase (fatty acid hydroxylase superfamily)